MRQVILVCMCAIFPTSCFRGSKFFSQSKSGSTLGAVTVQSLAGGVTTGQYDPMANVTQVFSVPEGDVSGAILSMPPGALSVPVEITIQPGTDVASSSLAGELDLDAETNLQATGSTVVVTIDKDLDANQPFKLSIPVIKASLALDETKYYVVVYLVRSAKTGENRVGIIPTNQIRDTGSAIEFETKYFGAFQVATVDKPITKEISTATERKIVTKQDVEGLALTVETVVPLIIADDDEVTLTGTNFRESMTIALGDKSVSQLNVVSDVKATFTMPASTFGSTALRVSQDGIKESGKVFALADKTGLPLITLDAGSVCSSITYYDINGDEQTGTKDCGTSSATSSSSTSSSTTLDGGSVSASATITLGSPVAAYYKITGSNTSISSISSADAGTRISLEFDGTVQLVHSANLIMPKSASFWTQQGDVFEFLSLGSGTWSAVAASVNHDAYFVGQLTTAVTVNSGSESSAVALTATSDDQANYDSNTSRFVAKKSGFYLIALSAAGTYSGSPAMVYFYAYRNGSASSTTSALLSCSSGACSVTTSISSVSPFFLAEGDHLEFKLAAGSGGNVNFTAGSVTSVTIKLVNENQ